MAKIRTVYPSDMVCHLWANGHAHDIRTQTGNLYTEKRALYSYGRHYVIGAFLTNAKNETILILNDKSYSSTTAQHASKARRALSREQLQGAIYVPALDSRGLNDVPGLAYACLMQSRDYLQKTDKARDRLPVYVQQSRQWLENARKLYYFAGLNSKARAIPNIADNAGKSECMAIYAEMVREDLKQYIKNEYENSRRAFELARIMSTEDRYTARGIMRELSRAMQHAKTCKGHAKKIKAKNPPGLNTLEKSIIQLSEQWQGKAQIEQLQETRENIGLRVKNAIQELSEYRRMRKTGKFNRAVLWSIDKLREECPPKFFDEKQARAIWGKQGEENRAFIGHLIARGSRIADYDALARGISRMREDIKNYENNPGTFGPPELSGLSNRVRMLSPLPAYWVEMVNPLLTRAEELRAKHAEVIAARNAEKIAAWRAGQPVTLPRDVGPLVRIKGDIVQTSYGAEVPLNHAQRLLKIARAVQARGGQSFDGDGPIVGHFRVNFIGADFRIVIGCHEFSPEESENAAILIQSTEMQGA